MGLFSALRGDGHGKPASQVRSEGMSKAAKSARRGGSGIKVSGGRTKPAQMGSKTGR